MPDETHRRLTLRGAAIGQAFYFSTVSAVNGLRKSYLDVSDKAKNTMGAKEVTKSALAGLLNAHPPFVASIPRCDKNFDLWSDKVARLAVKGRDL